MGILTDGKYWLLRWPNAGPVKTTSPYAFTMDDPDRWITLYEWLRDHALSAEENTQPSRLTIAERFGPNSLKLLIIDELDFVPLSKTGAELLFEVFSQRYERGSILVTTNLPFDEWTEVFGSERLTGALLDRLTHRVHILEMNGESYRLRQSRTGTALHSVSDPPDA